MLHSVNLSTFELIYTLCVNLTHAVNIVCFLAQVMFNQAYALVKTGRVPEAMEELQRAKSKAAVSESRHKIISPALDGVMVSFTS